TRRSPRQVGDEVVHVLAQRPALGHGGADGLPDRRRPRAQRRAVPRRHRPLDRLAYRGRRRDVVALLPRPHEDAGAEVLAHELGIPRLVAVHRPRQHGLPVAHALHDGVPPAVAHERRRRAVRQDLQLRRPPGDHHAHAPGDLLPEPARRLREARAVHGRLGLARVHVRAVGVPQRPDEPLAAAAHRRGELPDLLATERRRRAERYVQHRRRRLLVEPAQALVPRARALLRRAPRARVGEHRAQRPNGEQLVAIGGRDLREHVEELPLQRAAGVDDHAGDGRAPALLAHPLGERHELLGRTGVGRVEDEAVLHQQAVGGVHPPDIVRRGEAVHPECLAVGDSRGLHRRERRHPVVQHDDAAVARRELAEERGERRAGAVAEGLEEGHHVARERGRGVGGRGCVPAGDVECAEADGGEAERARGVPAVHPRAGLPEVRLRRGVVHGEAARREQHGQVEELVQVTLRRERHRHDGD
ncbi:Os07g0660466, partial [Oryza sativa Japonica Group]